MPRGLATKTLDLIAIDQFVDAAHARDVGL